MNSLFEQVTINKSKNPSIILIDNSGSTTDYYNKERTLTIFDKMEQIITNLDIDRYRLIFWHSEWTTNNLFYKGIFKVQHVVEKAAVKQLFYLVNQTQKGGTYPHLAFDAIPSEWINNTEPTHIYFFTDGQISESGSALSKSVKELFDKFNNIHLHLYSVECVDHDFNRAESLDIIAGGDVFKIFRNNSLTKFITEFISYTPSNRHQHINNVIPPVGFISFGDKIFAETKVNQFITYLHEQIQENKDNEDYLLKTIQSLSSTIRQITKNINPYLLNGIINTFCNLFKNTKLDFTLVQIMLSDTVKLESQGKAIVFSEYRSKMNNLYKEANSLLWNNTKQAIKLDSNFISILYQDKLITGSSESVTDFVYLFNNKYPQSSIKIEDHIIPTFSLDNNSLTQMHEQCMRQYIRSIIGTMYQENPTHDIIVFIVLGLMLKVCLSKVDEQYKQSYRQLALLMLKKKSYTSDITELEKLENGNLPLFASNYDKFLFSMTKIKNMLNLDVSELTLWYMMCLALNNHKIINKQLIHCNSSLQQDKITKLEDLHLKTDVIVYELPNNNQYDYQCIINLTDTSTTGGYIYKPHISLTQNNCSPRFVLSEEGYQRMIQQVPILCPVCYVNLTVDDFEKVPAKTNFNNQQMPVFNSNPSFTQNQTESAPIQSIRTNAKANVPRAKAQAPMLANKKTITGNGTLVLMQGVVGAGKSTFCKLLQEKLTKLGKQFIYINTDVACKDGVSIHQAVKQATLRLQAINNEQIVIIDTCGEYNNANTFFGVVFNGWKKIIISPNYSKERVYEYLAWSLRNVLNRPIPQKDDNFWLNPDAATVSVCVNVHSKKSKSLFRKFLNINNKTTKEEVLNQINSDADKYQEYLLTKNMNTEVDEIVSQIS